MCILFFNNKVKLNSVKDVMSTSVNKDVKLDTKISVPENFVGLIYYSDKFLFSLPSGDYKFQIDTFNKVIKRNHKKSIDGKHAGYDFNIHYINTSRQLIELDFKAITIFGQKITYHLKSVYEIESPQTFANEILLTCYKTTNKRTLRYIREWFKDFAHDNFRKKINPGQDVYDQINEKANKYFKRYGIKICDMQIFKTNPNLTIEENLKYANNTNLTQNNENSDNRINSVENFSKQDDKYCPNCQSKIYPNSDYCHICGYKFTKEFIYKNH